LACWAVAGLIFAGAAVVGCRGRGAEPAQLDQLAAPAPPSPPAAPPPQEDPLAAAGKLGTATTNPVVVLASGLAYIDVTAGSGAQAGAGQIVSVHYTGWLVNGAKFDSSLDRGQPFQFPLGAGQVIRGWDEGVAGMRVGGVRKLIIPPQLGYGAGGRPPVIPPNATLIFEVQLLGVQAPGTP